MSDLKSQLIKLGSTNPELQPHIRAILSSPAKQAALRDGPVGRVLEEFWNTLHDFESALDIASREYAVAASYHGEGKRDAEIVHKEAQKVRKMIQDISMKALENLLKKEEGFVRKHGDPDSYTVSQRNKMFPR